MSCRSCHQEPPRDCSWCWNSPACQVWYYRCWICTCKLGEVPRVLSLFCIFQLDLLQPTVISAIIWIEIHYLFLRPCFFTTSHCIFSCVGMVIVILLQEKRRALRDRIKVQCQNPCIFFKTLNCISDYYFLASVILHRVTSIKIFGTHLLNLADQTGWMLCFYFISFFSIKFYFFILFLHILTSNQTEGGRWSRACYVDQ